MPSAVPRPATSVSRRAAPSAGGVRRSALRIVVLYATLATVWVFGSDQAIGALVPSPRWLTWLQSLKGLAFIAITSVLLYLLIQRALEALRCSEQRLRTTLESLTDGVLLADREGQVVDVNRAGLALFGMKDRREMPPTLTQLGERLRLRYPDGRPVPPEAFATRQALVGRAYRYEALLATLDGRDVHVECSAAPVRERRDGEVTLAVVVLRDISEVRRLESLRDEFLATAAHELKTPVSVVKGYAQLLQRWCPRGHEPREGAAFEVLVRQSDRIGRLVEELLQLSRLGPEQLRLRRSRFDLGGVVAEAVERMQHATQRHRLVLSCDGARELPVDADRERIDEVLVHLLDNAIRYSPEGGEVHARVQAHDGRAVVSVEDRGVGIPLERQPHIFTRYYRAHTGTHDERSGLGVGLHIAWEIVRRHQGTMWLESEPGRGSTFFLSLPLAQRPPERPEARG